MLLGNVCKIRTGKLDANAGSPKGKYPFFTCAQTPLKIDFYKYDCECVLVAGNCDLNVKYFNGKFEAYQRTYIIESLDKQQLDTKFLYYYLSSYIDNLKNKRAGGVIKFIKLGDLTSIEIPNLGLNEQIKCVHELETIEHRRMAEEDSLICYESLIKSRFNEMFKNITTIKTIGEFCTLKSGMTFPKEYELSSGDILYCKVSDMNLEGNEKYLITSKTYVEKSVVKKALIPKGSICFPKRGAAIGTNKKRLVIKDTCVDLNVMAVTPNELVRPEYLFYVFLNIDLLSLCDGSIIPQLNNTDINPIKVKIPSIDLQDKFIAIVHHIDKLKFNCQQRIKLYQELLDKKMDEYFG